MGEAFNRFVEQIGQMDPFWAYGALALSAFLENVLPQFPETP